MDVIALFIASIFSVGLGAAVLLSQHRRPVAFFFFLTTLGTALWAIGIGLFRYAPNTEMLQSFAQLYYCGAALIAYATYETTVTIGKKRIQLSSVLIPAVPLLVLIVIIVANPSFLITTIHSDIGQRTIDLSATGYAAYSLYFVVYYVTAISVLVYKIVHTKKHSERLQYHYLLNAYGWAGLIGVIFNLLLPGLGNYTLIWAGPLGLFLFVPFVYIAIARHGLFDLRAAVVRTIAYALSLLTLSAIYYIFAYFISVSILRSNMTDAVSVNPINILIALLLAFIFQPIKRFFDKVTDKYFYRDQYDNDEFLARLGRTLTSTTDLTELLERASVEIETTLKASFATFIIYQDKTHNDVVKTNRRPVLTQDEFSCVQEFIQQLHGQVLSVDTARHIFPDFAHAIHILAKHHVSIVLPINNETGFLLLGEQKAGGYSARDKAVLEAVSNEFAIAIQNARSVQEVRNLNAHLEQRIRVATKELRESNARLIELDATKDEFVSMASHQLRTPLTSVKGYISMVLEGDAGDISESQRQLLNEAFTSSERMVHLIGDFLNVSRLQTGKFMLDTHPIDLTQIVAEEVESMTHIAQTHDMKLRYHEPSRFPRLELDEGKLRQVIMNFIDNAIYYSHTGDTITVALTTADGEVIFTVKDHGIGVPKDVQERLFSKFFRADNAKTQRPDGTGIGLYLAQKIITTHGGSMVFESTEGKGSTFGFRLPIKKLSV